MATISGDALYYNATSLTPNLEYSVSVVALSRAGVSSVTIKPFYTLEDGTAAGLCIIYTGDIDCTIVACTCSYLLNYVLLFCNCCTMANNINNRRLCCVMLRACDLYTHCLTLLQYRMVSLATYAALPRY